MSASGLGSPCRCLLCMAWVFAVRPTYVQSSASTAPGAQTVSVRLDNTTLDGVVEVSVVSGVWAYVQPSRRVGSVCCKQLGLGPVSFVNSVPPPEAGAIYDIACEGTEESLSDCVIDMDIQVYSPSALRVGCLPATANELDVILVRRYSSLDEGYVFTFVDGAWGPICSNGPSYQGGYSTFLCQTVCRQLGFGGCNENAYVTDHKIFKHPVLKEVACPSQASALANCSFQYADGKDGCPGEEFLKVACQDWDTYSENYVYNLSMELMDYSSVRVPYQTRPPVYDKHRTTLYIIALVVVSLSGMVLYAYRRNRYGNHRIFLDRFPHRNRTVSAPSDDALNHHHQHSHPAAPSEVTVMYHASNNGAHVQYDPPPPIDDPPPPMDDSELPTYEEAVGLTRNEV